jgi:type II secretory pathway pseudopilin PulG
MSAMPQRSKRSRRRDRAKAKAQAAAAAAAEAAAEHIFNSNGTGAGDTHATKGTDDTNFDKGTFDTDTGTDTHTGDAGTGDTDFNKGTHNTHDDGTNDKTVRIQCGPMAVVLHCGDDEDEEEVARSVQVWKDAWQHACKEYNLEPGWTDDNPGSSSSSI